MRVQNTFCKLSRMFENSRLVKTILKFRREGEEIENVLGDKITSSSLRLLIETLN